MMSFLQRRYHLVLLGLAVLAAIGSIVFLLCQSEEFHNSFASSPLSAKSTAYTNAPSNIALEALESLKKGVVWAPRADGASPFVSRPYLLRDGQLIDPTTSDTPLHPPVPNQWLIDHKLDYSDMNILERDPKNKGFTVLEEFEAGTDPNDPAQLPPLCAKLGYTESDVTKNTCLLEFTEVEEIDGKRHFAIKPSQPIPNPDKGNRPDTSARLVDLGQTIPGADFLKVVDYRELPRKTINDTEYDANELVLENIDTKEKTVLIPKNTSRDYKTQLKPIEHIKNIRFHYQLAGAPEVTVTVDRGNKFTLSSLNKSNEQSFKLLDISKDGAILQKEDGKTFTVKPSSPNPTPAPTPHST